MKRILNFKQFESAPEDVELELELEPEDDDDVIDEKADPYEVTSKDKMRITDIVRKSEGNKSKMKKLAETMAKLIKDVAKATRRALAAEEENLHDLAQIFFDRAKELEGVTVKRNPLNI